MRSTASDWASVPAPMAKAGHTDMSTAKICLHLVGTVFRAEAEAHERRRLGELESSSRRIRPQPISED